MILKILASVIIVGILYFFYKIDKENKNDREREV